MNTINLSDEMILTLMRACIEAGEVYDRLLRKMRNARAIGDMQVKIEQNNDALRMLREMKNNC